MIYFFLMLLTAKNGRIGTQRMILYFISSLSNFGAIWLVERDINLVVYISPWMCMSYTSFIFNEGSLYLEKDDPLLLMLGFVASQFLSSCVLSINFETTAIFQLIANILAAKFYSDEFGYNVLRMYPTMILLYYCSIMVCFNYEMKDKAEFLEKKKNIELQQDLRKILKEFPEAVIIHTKSKKND